jgi:hypothetical protein
MVFTLHGQREAVRYALIQTSTDWLLHRMKDQSGRTTSASRDGPGKS